MRIAFTTESGEVHNLEIDSQMELENIKALIETMTGIAPADQILSYHEQELTDPKKTLEQYGVIQDDILFLKKSPPSNQPSSTAAENLSQFVLSQPNLMQQLLQLNPELADAALNDPSRFTALIQQMEQRRGELSQRMQQINMLNADPYDVESQRRIEEEIRMQNVYANMEAALEYSPESFGRVTMLYINVEVNGHPVKAFVDSGAQATIMSPQCAENCEIMRLVDKRFAGIAKGVGTAKIIGRVHAAPIRVGTDFLTCSFTIMEGRGVDLLFGLDMLKRHQACIDLRKNALIINDKEIRFLAEHELPESARMDEMGENLDDIASSSSALNTKSPSISSSTIANPSSSNSSSPVSQQHSQYPEEHIQNLISMGFGITRDEAIKYLEIAGGNVETAVSLLIASKN